MWLISLVSFVSNDPSEIILNIVQCSNISLFCRNWHTTFLKHGLKDRKLKRTAFIWIKMPLLHYKSHFGSITCAILHTFPTFFNFFRFILSERLKSNESSYFRRWPMLIIVTWWLGMCCLCRRHIFGKWPALIFLHRMLHKH